MRYRTFVIAATAGVLFVSACRKDPPPPPEPTGPTAEELAEQQRIRDSIAAAERARADSIAAAEEAARARAEALREATETLKERIHFDYDMAEIRPDAERVLRDKLAILRASPGVQLRIEGHCDERGSNEYNDALGNRRAQAVVDFFTSFGLDASRFRIVSFGEDLPLMDQSNEDAWAMNRRAEFVITAGADDINVVGTP